MDPFGVLAAILDALTPAFDAAYGTGRDRPHPRRYVSDGSVFFDWSPLIAVEWDSTEPAVPDTGLGLGGGSPAAMGGGFLPLRMTVSIHVTRDSPWPDNVGTPPTPQRIQESAVLVHADARLVIDTLLHRLGDDSLFGVCGRVDFIRQAPIGPDGGVCGSVTTIAVHL